MSHHELISSVKGKSFLGGLLILLSLAWAFGEFWDQADTKWEVTNSHILVSILFAWLSAVYAKRRLKIISRWFGKGYRMPRLFIIYFIIWITGLWFSYQDILGGGTAFKYLINITIVYIFASGFFEICNLIKVGVSNEN